MYHKSTIAVLLVALSLATAGCKNNGNGDMNGKDKMTGPKPTDLLGTSGIQKVEILRSHQGNDDALNEVDAKLINAPDETEADLSELNVNFDEESVILVAAGQTPTGGFSVDITNVERSGNHIFVKGKINKPDGPATQAITHPYAAVVVPKLHGELHPEID